MRLGLRAKLFLAILGFITLCLVTAEIYLSIAVEDLMVARIRDDLVTRLGLIEREASVAPNEPSDLAAWDGFADAVGERAGARVTIVDRQGAVIGDSHVALARLRDVENHAGRPEIVAALGGAGRGTSTRFSTTVEKRMMYVASTFRRGDEVAGVVRIALPLTAVDEVKASVRRLLLVGAGIALVLAALLSIAGSAWLSRPVRAVTRVARAMSGGDLTVRTRATGRDEVSEMGRALDALASSLEASLAAVRAERDRLSHVLDGMSEGLVAVGHDGKIALVNRALREIFMLPRDVEGLSLLEVIRNAELKALMESALKGEGGAEGEIETAGLRPRRLLVRATPFRSEPGGVLGVFVDVTNVRRLEAVRREFVANASHELRTPIAAIVSASETLACVPDSDAGARAKFIEMISRNATRLADLVGDLLDLSRIESREFRFSVEDVDVRDAVETVVASYGERAARRGMTIRVEVPEAICVKTDPRALRQVLTNLVDNAVKYADAESAVHIDARRGFGQVRIVVADEGPGIALHHLPHVFERFYRVDPGRSRDVGGTGLGLSIVKNLVEALGGTVFAESEFGRFTRFVVTLPS